MIARLLPAGVPVPSAEGTIAFEGAGLVPPESPCSLAELLLSPRPGERTDEPILLGTREERYWSVTLGQLRWAILELADELERRGLRSGESVCLLRLPRTSETTLAVMYAALSCAGIRVLLPMYTESDELADWLRRTNARAVIWAATELASAGAPADRERFEVLNRGLAKTGLPVLCVRRDLKVEDLVVGAPAGGPDASDPRIARLLAQSDPSAGCVILTTAGSSGRGKLVLYRQRALLCSCAAWEQAGFFGANQQGGRGLCLLFSHSMGVRAFWNAVWTRTPLCLIPPEWFLEHPERVRALLGEMQPAHITGGPAVYHALLELARVFPDVKEQGLASLRCLVSSGAPLDADLGHRIEVTFGLRLESAFGTTETMQVLSTLLPPPLGPALGSPLPGVRIRLEPCGARAQHLYRLRVASPFGFAGYLGDALAPAPEWYCTGDLFHRSAEGFEYAGREEPDVVKDGFGVKVPRALVERRYAELGSPVSHLEVVPLAEEPGLGALVFVNPDEVPEEARGQVPLTHEPTLRRIRTLLEGRHEELLSTLDDFELRHLTLDRFACVAALAPRTGKGNVKFEAVRLRWPSVMAAIVGRWQRRPGLVRLERETLLHTAAARHVRPRLADLMRGARLDREYVDGVGDRLAWRDGPREGTVVDFVGGFGVTLLGHRHPAVIAAASRFLDGPGVFLADQGSERRGEGRLAQRLSALVGGVTGGSYVVRLGSTGAEAVEMALAHAWLEWLEGVRTLRCHWKREFGSRWPEHVRDLERTLDARLLDLRPVVLALAGGFHGYSLGARALSTLRSRRAEFAPLVGLECRLLEPEDFPQLEGILSEYAVEVPTLVRDGLEVHEGMVRLSRVVAAIAEPVQGEGGIRVTDSAALASLQGRSFPLVLDEIQCGLGRTGTLLASTGVRGDYYLLGKALGGGVAKIAALLIDRARYRPTFDDHYTGTFQGDAFSCAVAESVLDVIARDDIPARARERGRALRTMLDRVRVRFPSVVRRVTGEGLMLGVTLGLPAELDRLPLRMLAHRDKLGLLASAYLLNQWDVRVLPTLSAPDTIRLEPSAYVDDRAIDQLEQGLEDLCGALARGDGARLFGFLVRDEIACEVQAPPSVHLPPFTSRVEPPAPGAVRVAFINHFVLPERELAMVDPTLAALPLVARRALFDRMMTLLELHPVIAFARNVANGRVWFASILIPADAALFEDLHRRATRQVVLDRLQEALGMGLRLGCNIATLGAYTSIVSDAGLALSPPEGMRLATGNSLTAALGARRALEFARRSGITVSDPETQVAVLGATGNIGGAVARLLARREAGVRRLCLVGRDSARLSAVRDDVALSARGAEGPPLEITVTTDLASLRECDVIVAAVNTNEPLIAPHHLRSDRRVLLVDLSVPTAVAAATHRLANVRILPFGGTVRVPGTPDFVMASHLPAGRAFACAGEALLLALEPGTTAGLRLTGPVDADAAVALARLAEQHGLVAAAGASG